ncbi:MAG: FKBP-type peptidyl-prolyl cis-trans isomerase, partial [Planctomycetota bacterium]
IMTAFQAKMQGAGASPDADATPAEATADDATPAEATADDATPAEATADEATPAEATADEATPAEATADAATPAEATADEPAGEEAQPGEGSVDLKDVSYCIGFGIGENLTQQDIGMDAAAVVEGIQAALSGKEGRMTEAEMQETMTAFQMQMMRSQLARNEQGGAGAAKVGEAFLAENKTKEGVTTTESGLQYKVIRAGEGKKPGKADSVTVHYRGRLINGTVFDSSYDSGEPASFPVGGVISGWTEALQLMQEGAKWELYIPSELGYGARGAGGDIGPNEVLIFEVELLKVNG